jgi:hypothetical protein
MKNILRDGVIITLPDGWDLVEFDRKHFGRNVKVLEHFDNDQENAAHAAYWIARDLYVKNRTRRIDLWPAWETEKSGTDKKREGI